MGKDMLASTDITVEGKKYTEVIAKFDCFPGPEERHYRAGLVQPPLPKSGRVSRTAYYKSLQLSRDLR